MQRSERECMYVRRWQQYQAYGPRPCVGQMRKRTAQGGAGVGHKDQASGQPCRGYSERAELGRQGIPLRFTRRDAVAADGQTGTAHAAAHQRPPRRILAHHEVAARARRSCRLWCVVVGIGGHVRGVPRSCVRPPSNLECGASRHGHWRESGRGVGWNKGAAKRAAVRSKSGT